MAVNDISLLPTPAPEHRRVAAGQFERANQVISTGNFDYGIRLLLSCCKLDPGNLVYRQALRRTEKTKYKNNMRGSRLAGLRTWTTKAKLKNARRNRDFLKLLEYGEAILVYNPWDVGAQMDMAEAADELGQLDLAVWMLEQARQKEAHQATLSRMLARLYERRGNYAQAFALWELVRKAQPDDVEAQHKAKDLTANETIMRGGYEEAVHNEERPPAPGEAAKEEEGEKQEKNHDSYRITPARVTDARVIREAAPLQARLKADPTNPHAYLNLAVVFRRANQFDKAREILEEGLAATGQSFELSLALTELAIEPFRHNLTIAEEKLKTTPEDDEVRKIRIRLLKEINTRELDLFRQKA